MIISTIYTISLERAMLRGVPYKASTASVICMVWGVTCTGLQTDEQPASAALSGGDFGGAPYPSDPPDMPGINRAGLLNLRYNIDDLYFYYRSIKIVTV